MGYSGTANEYSDKRDTKMTIWFTSDNHFGHMNIIKYANRPFLSVAEMDKRMIDYWNTRVSDNDIVYHLGDFTLGDIDQAQEYFSQLKGLIRVLGNPWHHDKRWIRSAHMLVSNSVQPVIILPPMVVLEFPEYGNEEYPQTLVLCHYPIGEWDRKHYGAWHLHGHSHGRYVHKAGDFVFDIGVDSNQFYPIALDGVARQMNDYKIIKESKNENI